MEAIYTTAWDILWQAANPNSSDPYTHLLEQVNSQLSLAWAPYSTVLAGFSLAIGALSVLVSLGAIAAAFIIWRQDKQHKSAMAADKAAFDSLVADQRATLEKYKQDVSKWMDDAEKTLKERLDEAKSDNQAQVKAAISRLAIDRAAIGSSLASMAMGTTIGYTHSKGIRTCTVCGQPTVHDSSKPFSPCQHCGSGPYGVKK